MKIGIVTIIDYTNYGNRLQNYAVQKVLNNLGHETETILNMPYNDLQYVTEGVSRKERFKNKIGKNVLFSKVLFMKKKLGYYVRAKKQKRMQEHLTDEMPILYKEREKKFRRFSDNHIVESSFCLSEVAMNQKELEEFDFFVSGSDQVWNPNYKRGNAIYFLQFAPEEKRIAFSASFGISEYPANRLIQLGKYLDGIKDISVREEKAKKIVEENSSKHATVIVDPTLMLERSEWDELVKKPKWLSDQKYIVCFFLGGVEEEVDQYIRKQAAEDKCEVISLLDERYKDYFTCDPSEFLYLIKNAESVYTDSFHASVFSIIYHKKFQVFRRRGADMFSRLETLLGTFGLEECICTSPYTANHIAEEKYIQVDQIIEKKRKEAIDWISDKLR